MLVHHDPVLMERLETASIKFLGEQPCCMPQRIRTVINDQVIGVLPGAQKLQTVLIIHGHPVVIKPVCILRKMFPARIDKQLVRLDYINMLYLLIIRQLSRHSAVPAAQHQYIFDMRMHRHRHMDNHFIVNKFIFLRKYHISVRGQYFSEFRRLENIQPLKFALRAKQLPLCTNRDLYIIGMHLTYPKIHQPSSFSTFSLERSRLSGPCIEHPLSCANRI